MIVHGPRAPGRSKSQSHGAADRIPLHNASAMADTSKAVVVNALGRAA